METNTIILIVICALLGLSEGLSYTAHKSNGVLQLLTNLLKLIKSALIK